MAEDSPGLDLEVGISMTRMLQQVAKVEARLNKELAQMERRAQAAVDRMDNEFTRMNPTVLSLANGPLAQVNRQLDQMKVDSSLAGKLAAQVDALTGVSKGTLSAREAAEAFTAANDNERASFDRLRASVDPAYASTRRYEQILKEVDVYRKLGIITQEEANLTLKEAERRYRGVASAAGTAGRSMAQAARREGGGWLTENRKFQIRDASYQVSDLAVQVGGGTSFLRAFGQQAPQLLGSLGLLGAGLGALVAIAVPLASALMGDSAASKSLKENVDDLQKAVSTYNSAAADASEPTEELAKKYGAASEAARHFLEAIRDVDQVKAMKAMQDASSSVQDAFGNIGATSAKDVTGLDSRLKGYVARLKELRSLPRDQQPASNAGSQEQVKLGQSIRDAEALSNRIDRIAANLGVTRDQAVQVAAALAAMNGASGPKEAATAADQLRAALLAAYGSVEKMPAAVLELYNRISEAGKTVAGLVGGMDSATNAISRAADAADRLNKALSNAMAAARTAVEGADLAKQEAEVRLKYIKDPTEAARQEAALRWDAEHKLPDGVGLPGLAARQMGEDRARYIDDAGETARINKQISDAQKSTTAGTKYAGKLDGLFGDADNQLLQAQMQLQMIGKSQMEIDKLQVQYGLLAKARERNLDLDKADASSGKTLREEIAARSQSIAEMKHRVDEATQAQQFWQQEQDQLTDSVLDAIVAGKGFDAALADIAKSLEKAALQATLFGQGPLAALFGMSGSGGKYGGLLGMGLSALGIKGYATGTNYHPGGLAVVGEQGPELLDLPRGSRVIPHVPDLTPRPASGGQGGGSVQVGIGVDKSGNLQPYVAGVSGAVSAATMRAYDQRVLPGRVQQIMRDAQVRK